MPRALALAALLLLSASAARAQAAPDAGLPEARLLQALLLLDSHAEGPVRAPGATALGDLGDPRAIAPLVRASTDRSIAVRGAALKALAHYPTAEAQTALREAALDSDEPQLGALAVESLAAQGEPGGKILLGLAGDESASAETRKLSLTRGRERFPALFGASPPPADSSGRGLAIVAGSLFGGYTLAAVGNLGANQSGPAIGAIGGALVGAGAAYLLTLSSPLSRGQVATITTAGGWGLATGLVAGALTDKNPSSTVITSFGLVGELAGLIPALSLRDRYSPSGGDAVLANLTGLAAVSIAAGSLLFVRPQDDTRPGTALVMGSGLLGLGAGAYFARDLHFGPNGTFLVPAAAFLGGLLGNDLSLSLTEPGAALRDRRQGGGWLLGAGLGAVAGGALAQVAPGLSPADDLGVMTGALLGRTLAGGALRLSTKTETADEGGSAAGLVVGGLVSAALVPHTRLDGSRLLLGSLAASWGVWQGLGFARYYDENHKDSKLSDSQLGGIARVGFGLGGIAGLALVPLAHVTPGESLAAFSTGFWALWLAEWINFVGDSSASSTLLSDLLISDAGLLAGSLAVSPLVKIPPAAFGIASLYGATGSAVFSLAAALFTSNQAGAHPIAAANVAGTIVGLGVGILGAATWHRNLYAGSSGSSEPLELRLAGVPLPQIVPLLGHGTTGLSLIWR